MTKPRRDVSTYQAPPQPVSVETRDTVVAELEQDATALRETAAELVAAGVDAAGLLFEAAERLDQRAGLWRQVRVTG